MDTPSNFGVTGERPTNPELLEYLASYFVKNGMSIKKLHRAIMLSSVYQFSTENDPANYAKDSGDRLYWRMDRKRMDAEQCATRCYRWRATWTIRWAAQSWI